MLSVYTTGVVVVAALMLILLERRWPYASGQRLFRPGFLNDLVMYTIVQSYVLGVIIFGLLGIVDRSATFERWHVLRDLPLVTQVVIFVISHDLYIYWFHRLQHRSALLWRTHEAHHSTIDVDWLSGSRSHAIEILVNQTVEFAPIMLLASPEVAVIKGAIDATWGMYIHSNVDVRSGWLQYVINGPEMHRWHHATDDDAHNKNFSTKLAVWDWIFGTAFLPTGRKPAGYGLETQFPTRYVAQHLHAFRRIERER